MKLIDWFKSKSVLINENSKIRKAKNSVENNLSTMQAKFNDISVKYIKMLEEKSEKFDLYIEYQNKCNGLINEKKEIKKQFAEVNEMCNSLTECNDDLTKKVEKLERKIKRMEKQNEKDH